MLLVWTEGVGRRLGQLGVGGNSRQSRQLIGGNSRNLIGGDRGKLIGGDALNSRMLSFEVEVARMRLMMLAIGMNVHVTGFVVVGRLLQGK